MKLFKPKVAHAVTYAAHPSYPKYHLDAIGCLALGEGPLVFGKSSFRSFLQEPAITCWPGSEGMIGMSPTSRAYRRWPDR